MKNNVIIGILGLASVIVAAVAVYILFFGEPVVPATTIAPGQAAATTEPVAAEPMVGEGSLLSLLSQAVPLECTITYTDPDSGAVSGTYFVAGGQVRGDFMVDIEDTESASSIIITEDMLYTWSEIDGEMYGMKASLAAVTDPTDTNSPEVNTPVPLDTNVQYDCQPWLAVDGSVFVPPSDVLFQDFSAMMERGMETPTSFTSEGTDQCALCDMVPAGEGQDECRAAFACAE